jgi:hypothetical protein
MRLDTVQLRQTPFANRTQKQKEQKQRQSNDPTSKITPRAANNEIFASFYDTVPQETVEQASYSEFHNRSISILSNTTVLGLCVSKLLCGER